MGLINVLLFLTACINLTTCNRVYVHPFNLFAFNKSECEKIQAQNNTIEKMFIPVSIESKAEDEVVKVRTHEENYEPGAHENSLTSLMRVIGFRAFKQWRELHKKDNVFVSYTNLYATLVSLYHGASGQTSTSLQDFLGLEPPLKAKNCSAQVNSITVLLKLRNIDNLLLSKDADIDALKTTCIFVSPSLSLSEKYIHDLTSSADNFYIRSVDVTDSSKAVNLINKFLGERLSEKTQSAVTYIDASSNFIYTSHVQMKIKLSKFFLSPERQHFWIEPNRKILVPMISVSGIFQMSSNNTTNQLIVKISLSENDFLLLLQPTNGNTLENIESSLKLDTYSEWFNSLTHRYITLSLPKLKIESSLNIQDVLTSLKLSTLLGKNADFSRISSKHVKVGTVINTVSFELEEGDAYPSEHDVQTKKEVCFNKPFIVALFEGTTKALHLLGRVVNPINLI